MCLLMSDREPRTLDIYEHLYSHTHTHTFIHTHIPMIEVIIIILLKPQMM